MENNNVAQPENKNMQAEKEEKPTESQLGNSRKTAENKNSDYAPTLPDLAEQPNEKAAPPLLASKTAFLKEKQPFTPTKTDFVFAILSFVLAYLFIKIGKVHGGLGTTIFTFLYAAFVLAYAKKKQIKPTKQSWFWFGVLIITAISFFVQSSKSLAVFKYLFLFAVAVYWCACVFNILLNKKTSNFIIADFYNIALPLPFKNFSLFKQSIFTKGKKGFANKQIKNILFVLLGVLICIPLLFLIMPLLAGADNGAFANMVKGFMKFLRYLKEIIFNDIFWQLIFTIPVAFYICGLVFGSAHKRYACNIDIKKQQRRLSVLRILPKISLITVLSVITFIYALFIACQIPYFFSAFAGKRPEGFEVYSAYARDGFFELLKISIINLLILICANFLSKEKTKDTPILKLFNIIISGLTIIMVLTAISKMVLYIKAYGMTSRRLEATIFIVFIGIIFICAIILQFKTFSIMRFAAVTGSSIFCILMLFGTSNIALNYNANAYLNGKTNKFDYHLFWEAGCEQLPKAKEILAKMKKDNYDIDEIEGLESHIEYQEYWLTNEKNSSISTLFEIVYRA